MKKVFKDFTITLFETGDKNDTIIFLVWQEIHSQWKVIYDIQYNNGRYGNHLNGLVSKLVDENEASELHTFTRQWCKEIIAERIVS
jgi:hypothetical protein